MTEFKCGPGKKMGFYWSLASPLVLLTLLCAQFCVVRSEQKFAMEPQDQTAIVGTRVTLPCRVVGKVGKLQWTKDSFGLGDQRHLPGYERYKMIGSDDEGDYSLEIYPVILEDDARYQCQVGPGDNGEPMIRSQFAQLTVYTPPEPPKIIQGERLLTTEDREIELECVSLAGKPPAEITWIDGLGNVLKDNIENIVETLPDGRRFNSRSILKLTPRKEHHNTTFFCQAQNQAERTYQTAKLKLEVKYAPKVTVSVIGGNTRLVEGSDVRLKCSADANPPDVMYRWYINDRLVDTDATTELHLVNVSRRDHDSIVKCEVQNAVGKSEESETLDISYGPRFRKRPHSVQADQGSTVTLTCDVDGNPQPDIVWLHEPTDRVAGTSANLSLNVNADTSGRYYCKASVLGFPEIGAEATVYLKGRPHIISHRTQFGVPGDNARIECMAYAVPPPTKILWSYRGEEITADPSRGDYSILEDPLSEGIKSTLIVRESRQEHFGSYNCTVLNAYGADMLDIVLKPQKSFPLLLILTGVIGGIVVIVAITMVIILCQRKVKKPPGFNPHDQTDVEKQCKDSDRSSNISDLKLDLRTGSSVSNVHCEVEYGGGGGLSETGSDTATTRIGVPLAGPIPLDSLHRYANSVNPTTRFSSSSTAEYPEFPPKTDGQNNNGYVPYVDYARDYSPPTAAVTSSGSVLLSNLNSPSSVMSGNMMCGPPVDLRYSAAYGNPYLTGGVGGVGGVGGGGGGGGGMICSSTLPPPPPPLAPAPPPYSARNGVPGGRPQHYITSGPPLKRASLATHV